MHGPLAPETEERGGGRDELSFFPLSCLPLRGNKKKKKSPRLEAGFNILIIFTLREARDRGLGVAGHGEGENRGPDRTREASGPFLQSPLALSLGEVSPLTCPGEGWRTGFRRLAQVTDTTMSPPPVHPL